MPEGALLSEYLGSPQYASPELLSQVPYNPYRADIWALGVTFYEMAMGTIKWPDDMALIRQSIIDGGIVIDPKTPGEIRPLIESMTCMNPAHRPTLQAIHQAIIQSNFSGRRTTPVRFLAPDSNIPKNGIPRAQQLVTPQKVNRSLSDGRGRAYRELTRITS
jgi:serine/threonine protein kinase